MENEIIETIKPKIHKLRGVYVILDEDLAEFYKVETRRLNEQVNRNIERFPEDFLFRLKKDEYQNLKSQFATSSSEHGGRRKLPYAFTEQGVAMLSSVLHSKKAVQISIQIINAFVQLRKFISKNQDIFQRLNIIETKILEHDNNFNKIFNLLENQIPQKGIFFEGQLFDAHTFISDLIRQAKKEIILIDNYIDDRTLKLFNKSRVKVTIYTKNITQNLKQDLKKYNSQYKKIEIKQFNLSHDRFLIIDEQVYHIGASLKDLGKKWFGFSKMDDKSLEILRRLNS
jgi:DNA-binding PadR family transcriptional regulator/ribosomal protein L30E